MDREPFHMDLVGSNARVVRGASQHRAWEVDRKRTKRDRKCIRIKHLYDLTGERSYLVGLGQHLLELSLYIKFEDYRGQQMHMRYHTWLP